MYRLHQCQRELTKSLLQRVFQPHQYARMRHFLDDFASSFGDADEIVIPNVFGAREADGGDEAMGAEELVSRICRKGGRARYVSTLEAAAGA